MSTGSEEHEASRDATRVQRIRLHRSVALISPAQIVVRSARSGLLVPLVQALAALAAIWLIVAFIDRLPVWVLLGLLLFAIVFGPVAVLGIVYNMVGTSFLMERAKHSARWQQGFLGLGLGTHELVPFNRIGRIEVRGDAVERLTGGDVQDVVHWDVLLVKDNGRELTVGTLVAARPLAGEAVERANALAAALAEMSGSGARLAEPPPAPVADEDGPAAAPHRRYRRIDREEATMDRAVELIRDAKTIAVVGVSSDPSRDSNRVAKYLKDQGYRVYMVNPTEREVLGEPAYASVRDLPESVDIVDIFRRSDRVDPVVDDAIEAGARAVWMQLGIMNEAAAKRARDAGLEVVMNRCTKIEHGRAG